MIGKLIFSATIVSSLWSSSPSDDKFLVIDSTTYNKIKKLNVLNGGIKTNYVIYSSLIDTKTMQNKYPEIFAYNGEKCYSIQSVYLNNKKVKKFDLTKEIEKLKLLNLLHNTSNNYNVTSTLNPQIIQAVGIICNNKLHIRGKDYSTGDNIGKYYIKSINSSNSNIIVGVK